MPLHHSSYGDVSITARRRIAHRHQSNGSIEKCQNGLVIRAYSNVSYSTSCLFPIQNSFINEKYYKTKKGIVFPVTLSASKG